MPVLYFFLFLVVSTIDAHTPAPDPPSPIVLILDGSGSMWGQINGKSKIVIARQVVSDLIDGLPIDQPVGLVVYGHRQKGDCEDIEELIDGNVNNREQIKTALEKINPVGRTPLANAALKVIEDLRSSKSSATIILISDGVESCGGDLCSVVKEAKKAGVAFKLHIVGFDIADTEKLALQCAAEAGEGLYLDASDGDELSAALQQTTEETVDQPGIPTLSVKVTKDGDLHDTGVQIFSPGAPQYFTSRRTYTHESQNPTMFSIPPGTYDIKAIPLGTDAEHMWQKGVIINEEGVTDISFDFSPGNISVNITASDQPWDCVVNVTRRGDKKGVAGGRTYKDGADEYEVNPGLYDITITALKLSGANTTYRMEGLAVVAGETTEVTHNFEFGELSILGTNNGGFWDCVINVSDDNKKSVGGGRTYKSDKNNAITKLLTPGIYNVHYKPHHIHGPDWQYTEQNVSVQSGQLTEVVHNFDTGTLQLGARHQGTPCLFNIYVTQDGKSRYSRRASVDPDTNLASLIFTPGSYNVKITPVRVENASPKEFTIVIGKGDNIQRILDF